MSWSPEGSWSPPWPSWQPASAAPTPPAYVSGSINGAHALSVAVTRPATVKATDLLVAYAVIGGATTRAITAPSGFASIVPRYFNHNNSQLFAKTATASEPASYTFSGPTASQRIAAAILCISGAALLTPLNVSGTATGTTTAVAFDRITTTAPNTLVILGVTTFTTATFTTPTGATARLSHSTTTECLAIFTAPQATGAQIPAYDSTASVVFQGWTAITAAIKGS